jgi:hypothetical protein
MGVRTWEDRLSELADYRKIYGTAMFLRASENTAWLIGSATQRTAIQVARGRTAPMTSRIQALRAWAWDIRCCLGRPFERACRLSQNPRALQCSLGLQRKHWAGYLGLQPEDAIQVAPKGNHRYDKLRIKALEAWVSEWDRFGAAWEDRLSELADYQNPRHCNVPQGTAKNYGLVGRSGFNTGCTEKERRMPLSPFRGIGARFLRS